MPFYPPVAISRTPANQTAISSATYLMNGLGAIASIPCRLTPGSTGRVLVIITGDMVENATAQTASVQLSYGTGVAPANAAALAGTQVGSEITWVSLTGQLTQTFAIHTIITGLVVGTDHWFDLNMKSSVGTIQATSMNFTAIEI